MVDTVEQGLFVGRHEVEVVDWVELFYWLGLVLGLRIVVDEIASHVGVEAGWDIVEEVLLILAHLHHKHVDELRHTSSMLPTIGKFALVSFFMVTSTLYRCAAVI